MEGSYSYGGYMRPPYVVSRCGVHIDESISCRVSKADVFKIRAKQVGLVALAVITAIVLSPVLLPVAIVGGIAFGGCKAISSLVSKVRQENRLLQEMRAIEEKGRPPAYANRVTLF